MVKIFRTFDFYLVGMSEGLSALVSFKRWILSTVLQASSITSSFIILGCRRCKGFVEK